MIEKVQMFMVCCDNCGEYDSADGDSHTCYDSKENAIETVIDYHDWKREGDNFYCPDCVTMGENDELILKEIPETE